MTELTHSGLLEVGWFGPVEGCWSWVCDHFRSSCPLESRDLPEWLSPQKVRGGHAPRVLLAVLEHRSDERWSSLCNALGSWEGGAWPRTPIAVACLLGSDWQGHRRTHPLPERLETFYWFQVHDRILPWLMRHAAQAGEGRKQTRPRSRSKASEAAASNPRIQPILDQAAWERERLEACSQGQGLAWILTDNAEQRQTWMNIFDSLRLRSIGHRIDAPPPWGQPELIVVDCIARDSDQNEVFRQQILEIRGRHPESFLVVVDPFPQWERWQPWIACGIDALVPRPAQVDGLMTVWQRWLEMRGEDRRGRS